jgi:acetoin utilization deacetylase AcuC-like enzyme
LARVHDPAYLDRLEQVSGSARALDDDTFTSPDSVEVAAYAAGGAAAAVSAVLAGDAPRALVLARPPGHHAEPDRAMGFCLYNHVAVAAAQARASGVPTVAIVDIDVHHGNGTQHIFEADPTVLYLSIHQAPWYPGTGRVDEVGVAAGVGTTVNVPLDAGATDADYRVVFDTIVLPVLRQFRPALLLVSLGTDAHARDPLGAMRLSADGIRAMTAALAQVADEVCGGRLVAVVEGGYDLDALQQSLTAAGAALSAPVGSGGSEAHVGDWHVMPAGALSRGARAVQAVRVAQGAFWSL